MICKVSCSIGELIDKISILNIKLEKSDNEKNNISKELNFLIVKIQFQILMIVYFLNLNKSIKNCGN